MESDQVELHLSELLAVALRRWWLLGGAALVFAILLVGASFLVDPVYRASTTVSYIGDADQGGDMSGLLSQFGGIAGLAGISLQEDSRRAESLALLESREFVLRFVKEMGLAMDLFANEYDERRGRWEEDKEPTDWELVERFRDDVLRISEDPKTGLVTVSILWTDPELAARWVNALVRLADEQLRDADMQELSRSIEFLHRELETTAVVGIEQGIFRLIEAQLPRLRTMLEESGLTLGDVDVGHADAQSEERRGRAATPSPVPVARAGVEESPSASAPDGTRPANGSALVDAYA